jgi:esterase/lipase superfamily enzyme
MLMAEKIADGTPVLFSWPAGKSKRFWLFVLFTVNNKKPYSL